MRFPQLQLLHYVGHEQTRTSRVGRNPNQDRDRDSVSRHAYINASTLNYNHLNYNEEVESNLFNYQISSYNIRPSLR